MDVRMPEMDGIEATRQRCLGGEEPAPRILILTTFDLDEYVYDALRRARAGSCSRTSAPRSSSTPSGSWQAATRSSRRRHQAPDRGVRAASSPARSPGPTQRLAALTAREKEVLGASCADGLSNREIAERLVFSDETVKTHVSTCSAEARAPRPGAGRRASRTSPASSSRAPERGSRRARGTDRGPRSGTLDPCRDAASTGSGARAASRRSARRTLPCGRRTCGGSSRSSGATAPGSPSSAG